MKKLRRAGIKVGLTMTAMWMGLATAAAALPGQSVDEVAAWMQAHPTLRAEPRERLSLRRSDTPARRYTFHASVVGPGTGTGSPGDSLLRSSRQPVMVRSEKFTLVDMVNGVSVTRLEDALRSLYGAEVYADYRRSQSALIYSSSRPEDWGTQRAAQAQISEGNLYGYLIEVIPDADGTLSTGSVTVMLKEDTPSLAEALRNREADRALERALEDSPAARPSLEQLLQTR